MENYNSQNLDELKQTNPEAYFQEILCEQDFNELKKLHEETEGKVDWNTLTQEGVCEVQGDSLVAIHWPGNLNLEGCKQLTSLGNLQSIGGGLFLKGCKSLTSLGNLQSVEGYLEIGGCKQLTSLGELQSVRGSLDLSECEKLTSLENLTSVGIDLYLGGCKQLTSLGKLQSVTGNLYGYGCTTLKCLGDLQLVVGVLDIRGSHISIQIEAFIKEKEGDLRVNRKLKVDEYIKIYTYDGGKYIVDFDKFRKKYGNDITKIGDEESKTEAKQILKKEYLRIAKNAKQQLQEIKELQDSGLPKEEIIKQIQEIDTQFIKKKLEIESFGIKTEEIDISNI